MLPLLLDLTVVIVLDVEDQGRVRLLKQVIGQLAHG